jgi:hypothetical protein
MKVLPSELLATFRSRSKNLPACTDMISEATELIFFGSRASAVNTRFSDLDVLVIGNIRFRIKRAGVDLISMPTLDIRSASWLNSELAGHISKYGVWVRGNGEWRFAVSVGSQAISRKEKRIVSLVGNLERAWARLHDVFKHKYRATIRRELQRLELLRNSVPIPPTPVLDAGWLTSVVQTPDILRTLETKTFCRLNLSFVREVLTYDSQNETGHPDNGSSRTVGGSAKHP